MQKENWGEADNHDGERRQSGFLVAVERGKGEHLGGKRVEVERTEQQRGRKLFIESTKTRRVAAQSAGRSSDRCTRHRVSLIVAPRVRAAASVLREILLKPASTAPRDAARKRMA